MCRSKNGDMWIRSHFGETHVHTLFSYGCQSILSQIHVSSTIHNTDQDNVIEWARRRQRISNTPSWKDSMLFYTEAQA